MKLRPPAFEIPKDDPFRDDLLGREESAKALTEIIRSTDDPLVMAVDAKWGDGKTTFLHMWATQMRLSGLNVIYVNTWESDFSDSAFISILGEIDLSISGLKTTTSGKARKAFDAAKKVGVGVIKRAAPAALKLATVGVIDADKMIEDATSEIVSKYAEDRIKQYEDTKSSVKEFRRKLEQFANEITRPDSDEARVPLVVIVDELDRCRPSYAIDVLETTKHLFSVEGTVFVIAADWGQLGNVVKARYGLDVEVDGYLRRFVDISFSLPPPPDSEFVDAQFEKFGLDSFFESRTGQHSRYDKNQARGMFSCLFVATNCSLRDQERCFTLLSLAIRSTPEDMFLYPIFLVALIVLKVKNPQLYRTFVTGNTHYKEVIEYYSRHPAGRDLFESEDGYGAALEAYFRRAHVDGHHREPDISDLKEKFENDSTPPQVRVRAGNVIKILNSWEFRNHRNMTSYLCRKIDLVGRIT